MCRNQNKPLLSILSSQAHGGKFWRTPLSVRRLDDDQLAGLDDVRRARYGESHKLGYDKKARSNQRPRLMQTLRGKSTLLSGQSILTSFIVDRWRVLNYAAAILV